ncbi:hypothetical protein [Absidia glauca]|uniref:LIM zinc-binding domain-containing protein n=1 Tax=Absidia glauca TaxID=4829 RepID=A0A168SXW6_ABSGL|nr:hypothetical protein [Absidia glauca]
MNKVAGNERISQILPTVKCSDCGRDVHLRQLGNHICSNMPPVPMLPILPPEKINKKPTAVNKPAALPISPRSPDGYYSARPADSNSSSKFSPYHDSDHYYRQQSPPLPANLRSPYGNYPNDDYAPFHGQPSTNQRQQSPPHAPRSNNDYYPKTPTYLNSSNDYLPRKNSTSPAPDSPPPPKSPYFASDWNENRNEGGSIYPRNDSLNNIHTPKSPNGTGALDSLMEDLMTSMNDVTNLDHNSQDHCASCGDEFDYRDDVTNTGKKCYHKSCLTCHLCRAPLDPRRLFESGNHLYCERDYNVVKSRVSCAACDRPIASNITPIKALGRTYHPGHIKCYHCYCPLTEKTGAKERQQRVYCRKDYKELFLPKCRACNLPVEKEAVSAVDGKLQGKWHLNCFGCHTCHQPFPDNTFYVFENLPYCRRHYHQLNNSLCRTCDEPIEGPCAQTIEGWRFHPACFKCNVCRCAITDVYYMYERRIYCETHIQQLQKQRNVRAEKRRTQFGRI